MARHRHLPFRRLRREGDELQDWPADGLMQPASRQMRQVDFRLAITLGGGFSGQPLGFEPLAIFLECALRLFVIGGCGLRRLEGLLGLELSVRRLSLKHGWMSSHGVSLGIRSWN